MEPKAEQPTFFKAITTKSGRRGVRLEQNFWRVLDTICEARSTTIADLILELEEAHHESNNTTSLLRVYCLNWVNEKRLAMLDYTSSKMIANWVQACPTPTIILYSNRKLLSFNQPFLAHVSTAFAVANYADIPQNLKLVLDEKLEVLVTRLEENGNVAQSVGYAIGLNNRRIRGIMNVVLVPFEDKRILAGFIKN